MGSQTTTAPRRTLGLLLALLLLPLHVDASSDPQASGCEARLDLDRINGIAAEEVLEPDGFVGGPSVAFEAQVEHAGPDCAALLNRAPQLLGAWLNSEFTTPTSEFTYSVTYVDLDNDPPHRIEATLDGRLVRTMTPKDPLDREYRDGAVFRATFGPQFEQGVLVPDALPGDHAAQLTAHDGIEAATPVHISGPRVHGNYDGDLLLPNPVNRLFIHPIANGPTLTPPAEVPPPSGLLMDDVGDGTYSQTFPIDPLAEQVRASWAVGEGADFQLRGYGLLEGTPGATSGFELHGAASVTTQAHQGAQAVALRPGIEGASWGGIRLQPEITLRVAHIGWIRHHYSLEVPDPSLVVRTSIEADTNADGLVDLCLYHEEGPAATAGTWTQRELDRASPWRTMRNACDPLASASEAPRPLDDIQDEALLGLAEVRSLRMDARRSDAAEAAPYLVDSFSLLRGYPNTVADIDVCFYGSEPLPGAPPAPLECVSDIGPHSGPIPAGARWANVWANTMFPVLSSETFEPRRPYLEPATFGMTIRHRRTTAPEVELPAPKLGSLLLAHDKDADGSIGPADPVLARQDGVEARLGVQRLVLDASFTGPDAEYALLLEYRPAPEALGSASVPLTLRVFHNDLPTASLAAQVNPHPRHTATFQLAASDPDETQGAVASGLGGLRTWRLSFGDGTPDATGVFPMPAALDHMYRRHGDYTARLVVLDAQGASAVAETSLSVGGHPRFSDDVE